MSHARKVGRQGRIHHWRRPWSRSCPRDRDGQGRCRHHRDRYLSADRVEPLSARDAGRSRGDRAVRAHESCPATAQIFGATGGYYCRYAISHTEGATFGPQPTVEDIASGWDCIRDGSLPNELDGEAMAWGVKAYSTRLQDLAAQLQDAESTKCLKSVVSLIGSSSVKLLRESSRTFAVRSHSLRKCPLVRFSPLPGHALQRPRRTRGTAKYGQAISGGIPPHSGCSGSTTPLRILLTASSVVTTSYGPRVDRSSETVRAEVMLATDSSPWRYAAAICASWSRYEPISPHAASTSSATKTAVGLLPSGNCAGPGSWPWARDSASNVSHRPGRFV